MVDSIDGFALHLLRIRCAEVEIPNEGGRDVGEENEKNKLDVRRAEFEPFGKVHEGGAGRHFWEGHCD